MSAILETVVGVASAGGLVLLLERVVFQQSSSKQRRAAIVEKCRVLERDRAEWSAGLHSQDSSVRKAATRHMSEIDGKLIVLADEEGKLSND